MDQNSTHLWSNTRTNLQACSQRHGERTGCSGSGGSGRSRDSYMARHSAKEWGQAAFGILYITLNYKNKNRNKKV